MNIKGPVLFAANHPNSFLDGVILTTLLKENLYSLARGDAFKSKKYRKLLHWLHLLPLYRTSEGVENLSHNYTTFAACQHVFSNGGMVIIFSEGRCINEWHLRPLKKGTARLAISTWQKEIDLTVIPVGFNYNTFRNFGKNVYINFGQPLNKDEVMKHQSDGRLLLSFNDQLKEQLKDLVFEINPGDKNTLLKKVYVPQPILKKILLALPAAIGFILHAPIYFPSKAATHIYFNNDHFDSALASILMVVYFIYLPLWIILIAVYFGLWWGLIALIFIPFCAWSFIQLKNQLD